jgi:hypothetical protein
MFWKCLWGSHTQLWRRQVPSLWNRGTQLPPFPHSWPYCMASMWQKVNELFQKRCITLPALPLCLQLTQLKGPCAIPSPWDRFTSLDGFLSTSPTPPPLRSPWLSTVTMHISSVSHVCSLSCSVSSTGTSSVSRASHDTVKTPGEKRHCYSTVMFPKCCITGWQAQEIKLRNQESDTCFEKLIPVNFSSHATVALPLWNLKHSLSFAAVKL